MFDFVKSFFTPKSSFGTLRPSEVGYSDQPTRFSYHELYSLYVEVSIVKKVVDLITNRAISGTDPDFFVNYARNVLQSMLIYGFCIIDKESKALLDPRFCQFNFKDLQTSKKLLYIEYEFNFQTKYATTNDLHIISLQSINSTLGESPLQSVFYQLSQIREYESIKLAKLKNGGTPSLILGLPSQGSGKKNDEFLGDFKSKFFGNTKQGRPLVIVKGVGVTGSQIETFEPQNLYYSEQDIIQKRLASEALSEAYSIPLQYIRSGDEDLSEFSANIADSTLDDTLTRFRLLLETELSEVWETKIEIKSLLSNYELRKVALDVQLRNAQAQLQFSSNQKEQLTPLIPEVAK